MGVMTGVAGGVIRDMLCGEIPLILRREIYATAALCGAAVFIALRAGGHGRAAVLCGVVAALSLRLAAIHWRFALPVFTVRDQ